MLRPNGLRVILGPGLAPGLAGMGVLLELQERGIPVSSVVGVSSGALVGALWFVGSDLHMAARTIAHLPWDRFVVGQDLGESDPLLGALRLLTRGAQFSESERSLEVVTQDIETGRLQFIRSGSLAVAVRAAISIPGLFEPLRVNGRYHVDGGTLWPHCVSDADDERLLAVSYQVGEVSYGRSFDDTSAYAHRVSTFWGRCWSVSGKADPRLGVCSTSSHLVVSGGDVTGGYFDFSLAEEWLAAGKRATAIWLQGGSSG